MRGEPPKTEQGGLLHNSSLRGVFFRGNDEVVARSYQERDVWMLMAQMANLAAAVKEDDKAANWALKSLDHARDQQHPQATIILVDQLVPHLLKAGRYAEVIDIALDTSSGWEAISQTSMNFLDAEFDVNEILGPKPSDGWNQVETKATFWGLLPAGFSILQRGLNSREEAIEHANHAASLCRQLAGNASLPELWNLASEIFLGIFAESTSAKDLLDIGNKCRKLGYDTLTAIAYMCTSLKGDYLVQNKAYAQLAAAVIDFVVF